MNSQFLGDAIIYLRNPLMMATKFRDPSKCAAAFMPRDPKRQWIPRYTMARAQILASLAGTRRGIPPEPRCDQEEINPTTIYYYLLRHACRR